MNEPAPKRRLYIDPYAIRNGVKRTGIAALFAAATYALSMAGWWLQVHR